MKQFLLKFGPQPYTLHKQIDYYLFKSTDNEIKEFRYYMCARVWYVQHNTIWLLNSSVHGRFYLIMICSPWSLKHLCSYNFTCNYGQKGSEPAFQNTNQFLVFSTNRQVVEGKELLTPHTDIEKEQLNKVKSYHIKYASVSISSTLYFSM